MVMWALARRWLRLYSLMTLRRRRGQRRRFLLERRGVTTSQIRKERRTDGGVQCRGRGE
jgi:hypothetical protein